MHDHERGFERIPLGTVTGSLRRPGDLRVLDFSQSGMAFATSERLEKGAVVELQLEYRSQLVRLAVTVRWVEGEDGGVYRYRVGAEFERVIEKAPTGLWDWILAKR